MVGGVVIEAAERNSRVFIDCHEKAARSRETCAIWVEANADSRAIQIGDTVWWQGGYAWWTPADKSRIEVRIPRIGFSGVTLRRDPDAK